MVGMLELQFPNKKSKSKFEYPCIRFKRKLCRIVVSDRADMPESKIDIESLATTAVNLIQPLKFEETTLCTGDLQWEIVDGTFFAGRSSMGDRRWKIRSSMELVKRTEV